MSKNVQTVAGAKEKRSFGEWWASPGVKRAVGVVYSLGAAVVIIGAMFKILHLPGAGVMLGTGLIIEALLFTLGAFDKPHPDYHWDHVFPALLEKEANPLVVNGSVGGNGGGAGVPGMEKLPEEEAKKITESIKNMSETAAQLAGISRVAGLTDSYADNLSKASEAAAKFAVKQEGLDAASTTLLNSYNGIAENMSSAQLNTKSFAERANELSKNLGSINTAYELQLKGIQSQASAIENQSSKINAVTSDFDKLRTLVADSSKNMEAYSKVTDQLAKNVSELNNVYGNMLNALKS